MCLRHSAHPRVEWRGLKIVEGNLTHHKWCIKNTHKNWWGKLNTPQVRILYLQMSVDWSGNLWRSSEFQNIYLIHHKCVFCIFRCQSIRVGISGDNPSSRIWSNDKFPDEMTYIKFWKMLALFAPSATVCCSVLQCVAQLLWALSTPPENRHNCHDTRINESCHTYQWVHINESCHFEHQVHIGAPVNESWHTHRWVRSHIPMSHDTPINESWHTYQMSYDILNYMYLLLLLYVPVVQNVITFGIVLKMS